MAPGGTPTTAEIQAYAPVIERLSCVLALASLTPVIFAARFALHAGPPRGGPDRGGAKTEAKKPKGGEKETQKDAKEDDDEEKEKDGEEAGEGTAGIGLPSILLLIASEVLRNWDLFYVRGTGKKKAGKMEALLGGISKGKAALKPSVGMLDNITAVVVSALEASDAFHAAHGIFMLTAAGVVLFSMLMRGASSGLSLLASPGGRQRCLLLVGLAWPLMVFCFCQQAVLAKAGKALLSEDLPSKLHLPCRLAALVLAAWPADAAPPSQRGGGPTSVSAGRGTPAMFAALQAASLVAALSAELAQGTLLGAVAPLWKEPWKLASHTDAAAHAFLVPLLLALGWLLIVHLQRDLGAMFLSSVLSVATSPVALAVWWPKAAAALGLGLAKGGAAVLLQAASVAFAAAAVSLIMSGGTHSILAAMMLSQVLMRIHGSEPFVEAFA